MNKLTHNGTDGRTYGGDPNLVHIPDHHRKDVGSAVADYLDNTMRLIAITNQGFDYIKRENPLCPGCYMIALIDAALVLARRYGQDERELARSIGEAFAKFAVDPTADLIEELHVVGG